MPLVLLETPSIAICDPAASSSESLSPCASYAGISTDSARSLSFAPGSTLADVAPIRVTLLQTHSLNRPSWFRARAPMYKVAPTPTPVSLPKIMLAVAPARAPSSTGPSFGRVTSHAANTQSVKLSSAVAEPPIDCCGVGAAVAMHHSAASTVEMSSRAAAAPNMTAPLDCSSM